MCSGYSREFRRSVFLLLFARALDMDTLQQCIKEHVVFDYCKKENPPPKTEKCKHRWKNVVAYHSDVGLVVCDGKNLRVIDVHQLAREPIKWKDRFTLLELTHVTHQSSNGDIKSNVADTSKSTPIPEQFYIHSIALNSNGTLLALQGHKRCSVLELSPQVRSRFASGAQKARCRSYALGVTVTAPIRKVAWHPLSNSHLLVLSLNNTLSMFNVAKNMAKPEQEFQISLPPQRKEASFPVSFAVGGSYCWGSWQQFSVYILANTGEVYALCPVFPYDCVISAEWIEILRQRTDAQLSTGGPNMISVKRREKLQQQIKFLKDMKGPQVFDATSTTLENFKKLRPPRRSGSVYSARDSSSDSEPESETNDGDTTAFGVWVKTRKPVTDLKALLQGPLNNSTLAAQRKVHSTFFYESVDILCFPSSPNVIITLQEDGVMPIYIHLKGIQPKWDSNEVSRPPKADPLTLWEVLDLQLPPEDLEDDVTQQDGEDSQLKDVAPHFVLSTLTFTNKFSVYHPLGIHYITLPWVPVLEQYYLLPTNEIPELPESNIRYVLEMKKPRPANPNAEHTHFKGVIYLFDPVCAPNMIVAVDSQWSCHCLDVHNFPLVSPLMNMRTRLEVEQAPSFLPPRPKFQSVTHPRDLDVSSPEALEFLLSQTKALEAEYLTWREKARAGIMARVEGLQKLAVEQDKEFEELKVDLDNQRQQQEGLLKQLNERHKFHGYLSDRVNDLITVVTLLQSTVSKAEREYFQQLKDMDARVRENTAKLEEMKAIAGPDKKPPQHLVLNKSHQKKLLDVLCLIQPKIDKAMQDIKQLIAQVNQL